MQDFIVLGLIPGTHIQITFALWLIVCAGIATIVGITSASRLRKLQNWVVGIAVLRATRRNQSA